MYKIITLSFLLISMFGYSQEKEIKFCGQHHILREALKNPTRLKLHLEEQAQLKKEESFLSKRKGIVYNVPVVFHVIHRNGIENVSRAQIIDGLRVLNLDFRKLNADASTVDPLFSSIVADIEVNFVLATLAPDGTCFNGVTRTYSQQYSYVSDFSDGVNQVNAVISDNDTYQGSWDGDKYLNIFICGSVSDGVAGYTHYPSNWNGTTMENGIWLRYDYIGSFGTSDPNNSRTLSHEVGHWLNLPHTWGSTNNVGLASNCASDDGVLDTPNTIGSTSCNYNDIACGPISNVENYMNYAHSCRKMFTLGQKSRMRTALTSSIGGRNNLSQISNLVSTGTNTAPVFCAADFMSNKNIVCPGEEVVFTDLSYNDSIIGWEWNFEGGTPSTSTSQNPSIIYNSPGRYYVSLRATNDNINYLTDSISNYINVLSYDSSPYKESFEDYQAVDTTWFISDNLWAVNSLASSTGSFSMKLNNYVNFNGGGVYELESSSIDLSSMTLANFTFDVAYANRSQSNKDYLYVMASNDCGKTWNVRKALSNTTLQTAPTTSASFTPNNFQWETINVASIVSSYCVDNFRFKFVFYSDGGNNLYIDNINIIDASSVSIEDNNNFNLNVYPNPANNQITLSSNKIIDKIEIIDFSGKLISVKQLIPAYEHSIELNKLSSGLYFIIGHSSDNTIARYIFSKL